MVFEGRITTKSPPPELALNLLRANKQIHDEARSVLYSQNTFDFFRVSSHLTLSFLKKIGPENTKWIESLEVNFPQMCWRCGLHLDSTATCILDKLQSYCPNLKRLTLGRFISVNESDIFATPRACSPPDIHTEILELATARLKAYSPRLEVTFRIHEECDCLWWKFCAYEPPVSWTGSILSSDDDDGFVDNDVKFDGEYEVDDDSDFWRRPADLRAETRSRRGIRKKS
ncbi:uncharacterized protein N7473_012556 [Penicillium subrubescens]|uniref:uncharacterized protein n=1 Tax=Penicillium subrubescens TaxID=1316194 RepID=UPI0025456C1F|nr:uncharacterized protein N7473_012556 [Penicillium subrubescens]KAJ5875209.1 hypothetical protein N7473_012556 [Penicillium subrubescens]